jgi:hypothetical protein
MKIWNIVKNFPIILAQWNGNILLIPSMVLSTHSTCFLITVLPQFMPLWMHLAVTPRV